MALTIRTNHHHIPLLSGYELTPKERAELDYIGSPDDEDAWADATDRFFRYRGSIYDTHEFMRCDPHAPMNQHQTELARKHWDGYASDSYFSGVVIRYTSGPDGTDDDMGYVQAGLYMS